jgi:hypothetical protein
MALKMCGTTAYATTWSIFLGSLSGVRYSSACWALDDDDDRSMHCNEQLAVLRRKALPVFDGSEKNAARVGRAPIAGDLDLRGVGAEELRVRVGIVLKGELLPLRPRICLDSG